MLLKNYKRIGFSSKFMDQVRNDDGSCKLLFKFSDEHPKDIEELWATLCGCWPNNLKVIIRYLIIVSGMAPQELLSYVSISLLQKRSYILTLNKFVRKNRKITKWL